jgi:hypothetical protein
MIKCEWVNQTRVKEIHCPEEGQYILIYGCLQGHIGEHIFCSNHLGEWEEMGLGNRAWCPDETCSGLTVDWKICRTGHATMGWLWNHQKEQT